MSIVHGYLSIIYLMRSLFPNVLSRLGYYKVLKAFVNLPENTFVLILLLKMHITKEKSLFGFRVTSCFKLYKNENSRLNER